MKKGVKNLIFSFVLTAGAAAWYAWAWQYPVPEVEGKFCGTQELCKIQLPKIEGADYLSFIKNPLHRSVYSVLRGATYVWGRDMGQWAHKGVDIVSTIGTPVYSMGTGEVVQAHAKGEWGNVITIKHQIWSRFIYSNYVHLSEILVQVGDKVGEGQLIWKIGNTGNTTGPHLHFQIDTNEGKHPYYPQTDCGAENLFQVVNEAKCWSLIQKNTLDPILFLETQGRIFQAEQLNEGTSSAGYLLNAGDISWELLYPIVKLGKAIELMIKNKRGDQGFLEWEIKVEVGSGMQVFPDHITYLGEKRKINLTPTVSGLHRVKVFYNERLLKEFSIFALDQQMITLLTEKAKQNPALEQILKNL